MELDWTYAPVPFGTWLDKLDRSNAFFICTSYMQAAAAVGKPMGFIRGVVFSNSRARPILFGDDAEETYDFLHHPCQMQDVGFAGNRFDPIYVAPAIAGMAEVGVAITDLELRMTIKTVAAKGQSQRPTARQLDLCDDTVRYHLRRIAAGAARPPGPPRRLASSSPPVADVSRKKLEVREGVMHTRRQFILRGTLATGSLATAAGECGPLATVRGDSRPAIDSRRV